MAIRTTKQVTRPLMDKKIDQVYVMFLGLPENISNILGREVESIERPNFNFLEFEQWEKGVRRPNHGRIEFQPISIIFKDDDSSLVTGALYEQIKRQNGMGDSINDPSFEDSWFDIKVKIYNSQDEVAEDILIKKCFISNVSHAENLLSASDRSTVTVTVNYRTFDIDFPLFEKP